MNYQTVVLGIRLVPDYLSLRHDYVAGQSRVADGAVEDFRAAPVFGPSDESFSVHGIPFSYNVFDSTPCFHDAPLHEGPIKEGLFVRIYYNRDCIQRVDVRR